MPFLILLSVTGGIYLFKDEINARLHADLLQVQPRGQQLASSAIVSRVTPQQGEKLVGYGAPTDAGSSARLIVADVSGQTRFVFVDPYDGVVLGSVARGQFGNLPLINFVRNLHSLEYVGWIGNRVIEIVAGWALILVMTGVYLWWPRERRRGVLTVRRNEGRRVFWRDLHAVTGVVAAMFIVFMAMTGLPWSGFWGENLKAAVNGTGLGYPHGYWFPTVQSTVPLKETVAPAPWTIANMPIPQSADASGQAISIDMAISVFNSEGMPAGYTVNLPMGPTGVWTASVVPDEVQMTRTMHLDQYSGAVLFDTGFSSLGAVAKGIEWGVSVHTGQQFGRINQLLMLLVCLAIFVMSAAAIVMWWLRRPPRRIGAPSFPVGYDIPRAVLVIPLVMGILFPLVGLSLLCALAVDALLPAALKS